ncbi:unnamed protein product [Gulo gulo]|uniref:Secreted protein n=1 Tax=Gulo gulo TaxID=48420 RepID=A0A9X9LW44_GULGU|nr:unnamed protein product [Gulo gulo]
MLASPFPAILSCLWYLRMPFSALCTCYSFPLTPNTPTPHLLPIISCRCFVKHPLLQAAYPDNQYPRLI